MKKLPHLRDKKKKKKEILMLILKLFWKDDDTSRVGKLKPHVVQPGRRFSNNFYSLSSFNSALNKSTYGDYENITACKKIHMPAETCLLTQQHRNSRDTRTRTRTRTRLSQFCSVPQTSVPALTSRSHAAPAGHQNWTSSTLQTCCDITKTSTSSTLSPEENKIKSFYIGLFFFILKKIRVISWEIIF